MQKAVEAFIKKYQLSGGTSVRYIDLVSEIGELGKEILKENNYGKIEERQSMEEELSVKEAQSMEKVQSVKEAQTGEKAGICNGEDTVMEIGDCLFSLLALCCAMNINAEEALQAVLKKYQLRFENKGEIGSGN